MKRTIYNGRVVFIGDEPGNYSLNRYIAFVGSTSYKKLLTWVADLDLTVHQIDIKNRNDVYSGYFQISRFIALGDKAAKHLDMIGVKYFKLPHPSGRNRKLNDKRFEKKILKECYAWIRA